MKLFGNRKRETPDISKSKTSSSFDTSATKERVESSQKAGENKHVQSTIDQIIHKDFHLLNSKQRRQLKRHRTREIESIREAQGMLFSKSSINILQQRSSDDIGSLIDAHSGYRYIRNDSAAVSESITEASIDRSVSESGVQEFFNRREITRKKVFRTR